MQSGFFCNIFDDNCRMIKKTVHAFSRNQCELDAHIYLCSQPNIAVNIYQAIAHPNNVGMSDYVHTSQNILKQPCKVHSYQNGPVSYSVDLICLWTIDLPLIYLRFSLRYLPRLIWIWFIK